MSDKSRVITYKKCLDKWRKINKRVVEKKEFDVHCGWSDLPVLTVCGNCYVFLNNFKEGTHRCDNGCLKWQQEHLSNDPDDINHGVFWEFVGVMNNHNNTNWGKAAQLSNQILEEIKMLHISLKRNFSDDW